MQRCLMRGCALALGLLLGARVGAAQPAFARSEAWEPMLTQDGVHFAYLFYSEANNTANGVVVLLANTNDYPVRYRFKMVFRSLAEEKEELVEGTLEAGEMTTGSEAGLFWIPFPDGQDLAEVGLRGYKIVRIASVADSS